MLDDLNVLLDGSSLVEPGVEVGLYAETLTVEPIDYSMQLESLLSVGLIITFSIGLLSGLLLGKILWERVNIWK